MRNSELNAKGARGCEREQAKCGRFIYDYCCISLKAARGCEGLFQMLSLY